MPELRFQTKILIDDDLAVCSSIKLLLKRQDYEVDSISHPKYALKTIERFKYWLQKQDNRYE